MLSIIISHEILPPTHHLHSPPQRRTHQNQNHLAVPAGSQRLRRVQEPRQLQRYLSHKQKWASMTTHSMWSTPWTSAPSIVNSDKNATVQSKKCSMTSSSSGTTAAVTTRLILYVQINSVDFQSFRTTGEGLQEDAPLLLALNCLQLQ